MGIRKKKVSELPIAQTIEGLVVLGVDASTNQSAKIPALMLGADPTLVGKVSALESDVAQLKEKEPVIQAASYLEFPNIGAADTLYVDKQSSLSYRWDETELKYYAINELLINIINGGE